MNDVAYALRRIARRPAVSIVVIVMLAIRIGSTTSMFSLFEVFLLRPLPVAAPEQLVNLNAPGPKPGSTSLGYSGEFDAVFTYPMFRDLEFKYRAVTFEFWPSNPPWGGSSTRETTRQPGRQLLRC